jgi:hypothetical protein
MTIQSTMTAGSVQSAISDRYIMKVLAVCFLGTHAPLVALAVYAIGMLDGGLAAHRDLLLVVLGATLAGTALTLFTVYSVMRTASR